MIKVVQRYLAANFILPFVVSVAFFVTFLLTFKMFSIIGVVVNKGVAIDVVLELVGHIALSFIPMAIPLSALFATIFTLNKLSEDSEIIALRSFGFSRFQLFLPFLILGILISILVFSLNQNLIPYSMGKVKNGIIQLTSRGLLADIKAGKFFTDIPNVTLFAEKVTDEGNNMEDVYIHMRSNIENDERVIVAEKGVLIKQQDEKWGMPSVRLHLTDGNMVKTYGNNTDIESIIFNEYDFPILSGDYRPGFVTKDRMRTSRELWEIMKIKSAKGDKSKQFMKTKLEFWSRVNTPIQCLVFILLGFSLGIKKGRGVSKNTGPLSMTILILYYAIFFFGVSLAKKALVPAYAVVFFPTILTFFVGMRFYKRLDWLS